MQAMKNTYQQEQLLSKIHEQLHARLESLSEDIELTAGVLENEDINAGEESDAKREQDQAYEELYKVIGALSQVDNLLRGLTR